MVMRPSRDSVRELQGSLPHLAEALYAGYNMKGVMFLGVR